jgi:hypothetical protein
MNLFFIIFVYLLFKIYFLPKLTVKQLKIIHKQIKISFFLGSLNNIFELINYAYLNYFVIEQFKALDY